MGSIRDWEFLDCLSDDQLIKKDFVPSQNQSVGVHSDQTDTKFRCAVNLRLVIVVAGSILPSGCAAAVTRQPVHSAEKLTLDFYTHFHL
jgi:hypothetical protein